MTTGLGLILATSASLALLGSSNLESRTSSEPVQEHHQFEGVVVSEGYHLGQYNFEVKGYESTQKKRTKRNSLSRKFVYGSEGSWDNSLDKYVDVGSLIILDIPYSKKRVNNNPTKSIPIERSQIVDVEKKVE